TGFVPPNVDYYREAVKGSRTKVYPFVLAWKTGPPSSLCKDVLKYYQKGADGIAVWDPVVERGYAKNSYEGNTVDLLGYLGHKELIAYWAKHGMPKPNSFPLLKLGDNEYSKWFPNTGY
ncbi:MAG: hypothetical protein M3463_13815, partial [Verrucomicrobiota bacterium]|nr:hypothetical protein [Verrucomicrobiota bacterium]